MKEFFTRLLKLPKNRSYFLFGPRNTGKSTLLKNSYDPKSTFIIDLLQKATEMRFSRDPDELYQIVMQLPKTITHVIMDEIQKLPALLDVVHRLMGDTDKIFILTGSSARKLKHGGANLLAGRAFVYHLYSLSFQELGERFQLENVLQWGSLPENYSSRYFVFH